MIFVTVGTHEQQFNRLIEYMDGLKADGVIQEDVIVQIGYSTFEPCHCQWQKLYPYHKMLELVAEARIVITHGGPSSFIMPLQIGKTPIVVPRQKQFNEHVNNHQVEFCRKVASTQRNIILVDNVEEVKAVIMDYETIVSSMPKKYVNNNMEFNAKFMRVIDSMFNISGGDDCVGDIGGGRGH